MNKLISFNALQTLKRSNQIARNGRSCLMPKICFLHTTSNLQSISNSTIYNNKADTNKFKNVNNLFHATRFSSTEANEQIKQENTEKPVGPTEKYEFLAETKQLLNIVAKSLYSENEVFIRELISNASDALEKLKYMQLSTEVSTQDAQIPFEIQLNVNDITNTLTIQVS